MLALPRKKPRFRPVYRDLLWFPMLSLTEARPKIQAS
jgi:hypothetical protein